jgi:hypothetical protein
MFSVDRTMELTFTAKPRSAVCPLQSTPEPCRAARKVTFGQFKQPQLATKPLPPTTTDGYSQTLGGDTHSGYIGGYIGGCK